MPHRYVPPKPDLIKPLLNKQEMLYELRKIVHRFKDPEVQALTVRIDKELEEKLQEMYGHFVGQQATRKPGLYSHLPIGARPCVITGLSGFVASGAYVSIGYLPRWWNNGANEWAYSGFDHVALEDLQDIRPIDDKPPAESW